MALGLAASAAALATGFFGGDGVVADLSLLERFDDLVASVRVGVKEGVVSLDLDAASRRERAAGSGQLESSLGA